MDKKTIAQIRKEAKEGNWTIDQVRERVATIDPDARVFPHKTFLFTTKPGLEKHEKMEKIEIPEKQEKIEDTRKEKLAYAKQILHKTLEELRAMNLTQEEKDFINT